MQAVSLKKRQTVYNAKARKAGYKKKPWYGRRQFKVAAPVFHPSPLTTKYSFEPNNPFGDKAIVKLKFNYANQMTGGGVLPYIDGDVSLNDLSALYAFAQSVSKGYLTYPKLFTRYRVTAVAVRLSAAATRTSPVPFLMYLLPYTSDEGAPTSLMRVASTIKQQRFSTVGYVAPYSTGAPVSHIDANYNMKAILGDKMAQTDIAWTGFTDPVANPYNSPGFTVGLKYGVTNMTEATASASDTFSINLEVVYTVEFFAQKHEQQAL